MTSVYPKSPPAASKINRNFTFNSAIAQEFGIPAALIHHFISENQNYRALGTAWTVASYPEICEYFDNLVAISTAKKAIYILEDASLIISHQMNMSHGDATKWYRIYKKRDVGHEV